MEAYLHRALSSGRLAVGPLRDRIDSSLGREHTGDIRAGHWIRGSWVLLDPAEPSLAISDPLFTLVHFSLMNFGFMSLQTFSGKKALLENVAD